MKYTMTNALTIICLLLAVVTHAQTPVGLPYQAAARNSSGAIVVSTNVSVRFTIRDSIAMGAIEYRETHTVTTSAQGIFSLIVGQGTVVTGTFAGINWGSDDKFLQVELDPEGGSTYVDMATQQLMSVPYALNTAATKFNVSRVGDTVYSGDGSFILIPGGSAANNNPPYASIILGESTVCIGSTTALMDSVSGGIWSSSNTSIATIGSTTGVVSGVSEGTTTISYTVTNNYGTSFTTRDMTVNPMPSIDVITGTATVCAGSTTPLSNTTTGGVWTSSVTGVATVGSTGVVSGIGPGTATISYIVTTGGCSATATRIVTVNPLPNAGTITGTATACAGSTTPLSNSTTGGAWSSTATSIATVASTGVVSGVAGGTATISYTVTNSCGTAAATRIVTVYPTSAGTITGTATLVVGTTTALSNATTGGTWSSGATGIATVGSTGVVSGVAAGTATISYTITNSCGSAVATRVVTVSVLTIGASYGGGVIAHIYVAGDPGYVAGETHGLIAAPSDQSTGIQWGCYGTLVGGTSLALGTGAANTAIVSAACGTGTAARLCADLVLNGYSDWYLPSRNELIKLYINRSSIGGFSTGFYWSSSEASASTAWYINFFDGATNANGKTVPKYVRALRAF
jgi:uncharacterized protein YjdB